MTKSLRIAELILKTISCLDQTTVEKWIGVKDYLFDPAKKKGNRPDDDGMIGTAMATLTLYDEIVTHKRPFPDNEEIRQRLALIPWEKFISQGGLFILFPVLEAVIARASRFAEFEKSILTGGELADGEFTFFSEYLAEENAFDVSVKIPLIIRFLCRACLQYLERDKKTDASRLMHIAIGIAGKFGHDYEEITDAVAHMPTPFIQVRLIREMIDGIFEGSHPFQEIVPPLVRILESIRENNLDRHIPDFQAVLTRINTVFKKYTDEIRVNGDQLPPETRVSCAVYLNRLFDLADGDGSLPFCPEGLIRQLETIGSDAEGVLPVTELVEWLVKKKMPRHLAQQMEGAMARFAESREVELEVMALLWPFCLAADTPLPDGSALCRFIHASETERRNLYFLVSTWSRLGNPQLPDEVWHRLHRVLEGLSAGDVGYIYRSGLMTKRHNPLWGTMVAGIEKGIAHGDIRARVNWLSFVISNQAGYEKGETLDFDPKAICGLIADSHEEISALHYVNRHNLIEEMLGFGYFSRDSDTALSCARAGLLISTYGDIYGMETLAAQLGFCGVLLNHGDEQVLPLAKKAIEDQRESPLPGTIKDLLFTLFQKLPEGQRKRDVFRALKRQRFGAKEAPSAADILRPLAVYAARCGEDGAELLLCDYFESLRNSSIDSLSNEMRGMDELSGLFNETIMTRELTTLFESLWKKTVPFFHDEYKHMGMIAGILKKKGNDSASTRFLARLQQEMAAVKPPEFDYLLEEIGQGLMAMGEPEMAWRYYQTMVTELSGSSSPAAAFLVVRYLFMILPEMDWDIAKWTYARGLAVWMEREEPDVRMMEKLSRALHESKEGSSPHEVISFAVEMGNDLAESESYHCVSYDILPVLARYAAIPQGRKGLRNLVKKVFTGGNLDHQLRAVGVLGTAGFVSEALNRIQRVEETISSLDDPRDAASGLIEILITMKRFNCYAGFENLVEKTLVTLLDVESDAQRNTLLRDLASQVKAPAHAGSRERIMSMVKQTGRSTPDTDTLLDELIRKGEYKKAEELLPDLVQSRFFSPCTMVKLVDDPDVLEWLAGKVAHLACPLVP